MEKPAARLTDTHRCPMITPALVPIPHVGSVILGPGVPTVLIGGKPASTIGDICICVGPPDMVITGSMSVLIGGKPAAFMGSGTAHMGVITSGEPTVLIGMMGPVMSAAIAAAEKAAAKAIVDAEKAAAAAALKALQDAYNLAMKAAQIAAKDMEKFGRKITDGVLSGLKTVNKEMSSIPGVKEMGEAAKTAGKGISDAYKGIEPEKGMQL